MKIDTSLSTKLRSGQVPFLFRQKSLITVSGHSLRPGGYTLTDLYIPHLLAPQRPTGNASAAPRGSGTDRPGTDGPGSREPAACLDGALPLLDLMRLLETAGFQIDILEDHTRLLNQLAGQIRFQHGSADNFEERFGQNPCTDGLKPGYCMIVAGKYV